MLGKLQVLPKPLFIWAPKFFREWTPLLLSSVPIIHCTSIYWSPITYQLLCNGRANQTLFPTLTFQKDPNQGTLAGHGLSLVLSLRPPVCWASCPQPSLSSPTVPKQPHQGLPALSPNKMHIKNIWLRQLLAEHQACSQLLALLLGESLLGFQALHDSTLG